MESIKDLWPGQSVELLKALHILTRDGNLNQDSRRKLKQVQHLVQLLRPSLEGCQTIVDLGAGKSYLGFMLYDLWIRHQEETKLFAVEARPNLIASCRQIAEASGFSRIQFIESRIDEAGLNPDVPEAVDVVTALHACDTATDDSLIFGLAQKAKVIVLIPCCHAEIARWLDSLKKAHAGLGQLWRHPHHRREFGSHLTNVLRALLLEAFGYKVRVTELIGWEHTLKNEVILATKVQGQNSLARKHLLELLKEIDPRFSFSDPPLYLFKMLKESGFASTLVEVGS